ncbi:MAG: tRNA methyl transferase PRC-barrel domain-containing protein [Saprospiraceae bacterium]
MTTRLYLKERMPEIENKYDGGDYIDVDGNVIGKHRGYMNYTIGQRKGLEIAMGKPYYVISIDANTNTVMIGEKEELNRNGLVISNLNLTKYKELTLPMDVNTMVRYKSPGISSKVVNYDESNLEIEFEANIQGVARGNQLSFMKEMIW